MKTITKRELVRNPSVVSHLKPGEGIEIPDGDSSLMVSRPQKHRMTAEEIEAEIQRICRDAPPMDCQAVLDDLRR